MSKRFLRFLTLFSAVMPFYNPLPATSQYLPLSGGTLSGPLLGSSINGAINPASCGYSTPPAWCKGTDYGGWVNQAYSALPSTGGIIAMPPTNGCVTYSVPIILNTANMPVTLQGAGSSATCLKFLPSTGTAITINTGFGSRIDTLEDFELTGPGPNTSTTGIIFGGSSPTSGTIFMQQNRMLVEDFGLGGRLLGVNTFKFTGFHVNYSDNGQNWLDDVSGQENNTFYDALFTVDVDGQTGHTAQSVSITSNNDWNFVGCSFDNAQLALSNNAIVRVVGGHFENPDSASYDYFTASNSDLDLTDVLMLQDSASGFSNGRFGSVSGGILKVTGGTFYSAETIPVFVTATNSAQVNIIGLHENSTLTSGLVGGTPAAFTLIPADAVGDSVISGQLNAVNLNATNNLLGHQLVIQGKTGLTGTVSLSGGCTLTVTGGAITSKSGPC